MEYTPESKALGKIFWGYILLFFDLSIFYVDIAPDFIGYIMIGRGMAILAERATAFTKGWITRILIIYAMIGAIWQFTLGMDSSRANPFDMQIPVEPDFFMFTPWVLWETAGFILSTWLLYGILSGVMDLAEQEGQPQLCKVTGRYRRLLVAVYLPASCLTFTPFVGSIEALLNLVLVCFYLLIVLHLSNLRSNLRCCIGAVLEPAPALELDSNSGSCSEPELEAECESEVQPEPELESESGLNA